MNIILRPICLIGCIALLLSMGCQSAKPEGEPLNLRIAKAYGFENFGQVEAIRFVFNAKVGELRIARSWIWEPKVNRVTLQADSANGQDKVSYNRGDLNETTPDSLKQVDAWFINDQYWVLFPFHLVWDTVESIQVTDGLKKLPIGDGQARQLIVRYPASGGYTPGDVYELYVDEKDQILEWVYRRGGAEAPTRAAKWQENKQIGPLVVSLNHPGAGDDFRVWLTEVAVKLENAGEWLEAK